MLDEFSGVWRAYLDVVWKLLKGAKQKDCGARLKAAAEELYDSPPELERNKAMALVCVFRSFSDADWEGFAGFLFQ
jgi:hypothetical protein